MRGNILSSGLPPLSPGHIFGTDPVGNDIFSRILYGGRVSFEVGFGVTAIGLVVGGLLGMAAGYWGGITDAIIMRVLDVLIAFPALVLALAIAEGLGPSELHVIWALSFFSIPAFGRIARGATLALREQTFMLAARLSGTRGWRVILRHIIPNIMPQLMTFSLLGIGVAMILEGALSFLGLGIPLPEPSWGSMIAAGQQTLSASPDLVLIPSAFLFATVVSLNLLGDALRERWGVEVTGARCSRSQDLRVTFTGRGRQVRAVDGVSYRVYAGQTLAIVGESGSGKTVSCRAVIGLLPPSAVVTGSARIQGTELIGLTDDRLREHRGTDVAMVFQDPARSLNPTMRVGAQIAEAVRAHRPVSKAQARQQAVDLLRLVHMPLPERRCAEYPHQLSGGMRQRVMIAIALACRPRLLIADEATTALDVTTQAQIMELLLELQAELGMALMLISHDLGLAAAYADEVIVMYAGRIVEQAPAARLFGHVRMPYTQALFEAIPRLERPAHSPLPVIGGRPPDGAMAKGCSFAPRCRRAADDCRAAAPPLAEHEPGHRWACWHPVEPGAA